LDWDAIGQDSLKAGRSLFEEGRWRSSISRSYYAAFSVVVGRILPHVKLPPRMMTSRHDTLPKQVMKHLTRLYPKTQRTISGPLVRLYRERIRADYNAAKELTRAGALAAVRMAAAVMKLLGVQGE
jgi:uncharacterized protein (UPF0332 family)